MERRPLGLKPGDAGLCHVCRGATGKDGLRHRNPNVQLLCEHCAKLTHFERVLLTTLGEIADKD